MRTWEALKMLTENRKLKFKNDDDEILKRVHDVPEVNNYSGDKMFMYLTTNWSLVQEPVTFMEAINSKKRIKPEHYNKYYDIEDLLENILSRCSETVIEFINGKWFIEDGVDNE